MRSVSWGWLGRADGRALCGSSLHQTDATGQPTVSHPRAGIHGARWINLCDGLMPTVVAGLAPSPPAHHLFSSRTTCKADLTT
ncbi:hypothetical protein IG631_22305 [Alternaria alternata]|nr:hypothetical protein IG631_22305 [Alternaria alternata]